MGFPCPDFPKRINSFFRSRKANCLLSSFACWLESLGLFRFSWGLSLRSLPTTTTSETPRRRAPSTANLQQKQEKEIRGMIDRSQRVLSRRLPVSFKVKAWKERIYNASLVLFIPQPTDAARASGPSLAASWIIQLPMIQLLIRPPPIDRETESAWG